MAMQLGWWGLCFLLYLVLLDHFTILWSAQNPAAKIVQSGPKAKRAKKAPAPRSPLDCRHCQAQAKAASSPAQPAAPLSVPAYSQTKSKRGRPKQITTEGYSCPNPKCPYYGCTAAAFHALVGDGCHGKSEQIQTF